MGIHNQSRTESSPTINSDEVNHFQDLKIQDLLTIDSHQITSLAFMIEKESGEIDNPTFPMLWIPVTKSSDCTT